MIFNFLIIFCKPLHIIFVVLWLMELVLVNVIGAYLLFRLIQNVLALS